MIIKSLLFIIVCMFLYETYNTLTKMSEEYFVSLDKDISISTNREKFINVGTDPDKNDIATTIAINCKAYQDKIDKIDKIDSKINNSYKPINFDDDIDTPYHSQFKALMYDTQRLYNWRPDILIAEGKRRSNDDDIEIAKVQSLFDTETDIDKKQVLQDELNLFKWRKNILAITENNSAITDIQIDRTMRDITSDYYPAEIGMNRPWIERHSHIHDYSY